MTALQILKDLKKLMERNLRLPSQSILPEIEKAIRWLEEELPREEDDLIEVVPSTYSDPIAKDAIDNLVDLINGGDTSLEEEKTTGDVGITNAVSKPFEVKEDVEAARLIMSNLPIEEVQENYTNITGKKLSIRYKNDRERIISKLYPQDTND